MLRSLLLSTALFPVSLFMSLGFAHAQSAEPQPEQDPSDTVVLGTIYLESGSTEGLGYRGTTTGFGGVETRLLSFPRSVSVITSDALRDRGSVDVYPALETANGVTLALQDDLGERSTVLVRGFESTSIQVDGSASSGSKNLNLFDTAIYDRIELLRGPSGVMQGAREPGATVNLVRKRPTSEEQLIIDLEAGSWNRHRAMLDWGGPVTSDGTLRGRLVVAAQEADSFIDVVNHDRQLAYGVLEYDLDDSTTLSVGATWQTGSEVGSRGLPSWRGGPLLDVPRSTFAGPSWAATDLDAKDIFAEVLHEFDNGLRFTLKGSFQDRMRDGKLAFADAPVDPLTGMTRLIPEHRIDREKAGQISAGLEIPFMLWGRDQRLLVLADYQRVDFQYDRARAKAIPFDILNPDYNLPEPDLIFDRFDKNLRKEYGLTVQGEIRPADHWTVLVGGRMGWYDTVATNRLTGKVNSSQKIDAEVTPYLALQHELAPGRSTYVSYSTSFVPQTDEMVGGGFVDPRTSQQVELGYKQDIGPGALLQVALFQIEEENRAVRDLNDPTGDYSVGSGKVRSRGFEAEISGEIIDNFEVTAGYAYLDTIYLEDPDATGEQFEPRAPRHSLKLWGKYTLAEGRAEGLWLAGGVSVFSERSRTLDGVTLTQGGYFTADAQVGYPLSDRVTLAVNVNNIFDRKYYHSVGYEDRQNYYGTPREVSLRLTSRF